MHARNEHSRYWLGMVKIKRIVHVLVSERSERPEPDWGRLGEDPRTSREWGPVRWWAPTTASCSVSAALCSRSPKFRMRPKLGFMMRLLRGRDSAAGGAVKAANLLRSARGPFLPQEPCFTPAQRHEMTSWLKPVKDTRWNEIRYFE